MGLPSRALTYSFTEWSPLTCSADPTRCIADGQKIRLLLSSLHDAHKDSTGLTILARDVWSVTRSKAAQGTCGTRHCAGTGCSAGGACLARCNSMAPFAARWGASGPCRVRSSALRIPTGRIPRMPHQVASVCDRNSIRPPHLAAREAADVERAIVAPPVTLLATRTFEQLMTALTFSSHLA